MFSSLEKKCLAEISTIRRMIDVHDQAQVDQDSIERTSIKVYAVSSCVTRLYAVYEYFVETAISDYLDQLADCASFESLGEGLKNEYRMGISHILSKINQGRYSHLKHEDIVKSYYMAITNTQPYRFVTDALTRHEENLRLPTLQNIFNKIELTDLTSWLDSHQKIGELFEDKQSIFVQLDAEVRQFVQLRNDAAHGILEDLEGGDNLKRLCDLITNLITAIAAYLRKSILKKLSDANKIRAIGQVTETFDRTGAFILKAKNAVTVSIGEKIYFQSATNCQPEIINSIRINDEDVQQTTTNADNTEIGIMCPSMPRKKSIVFQIT